MADARSIPLLTPLTDNKGRLWLLLHRWSKSATVIENGPQPMIPFKYKKPLVEFHLEPSTVELRDVYGRKTIEMPFHEFEKHIDTKALVEVYNPPP